MDKITKEDLKIDNLKCAIDNRNNITLLQESIDSIIDEMVQEIAMSKIINPLTSYLSTLDCSIKEYSFNNTNQFQIKIRIASWEKSCIAFNLEGVGFIYGICLYDVENNRIDENAEKLLNEYRKEHKFNSSKWWPCWKKVERAFAPNGDDYWLKVESGDMPIYDSIKNLFTDIFNATKNINL